MPTMDTMLVQLRSLWERAVTIWVAGGWGMAAIAFDALVLFAIGMHVHLGLRAKGFHAVHERTWRHWIDHPRERHGPIGALLDFVGGARSLAEAGQAFSGLRATELASFDRDLRVMRVCVTLAPLLGLFGTVTGMLATFGALASGSGGEKTMGMIAKGISEALITTETGLVIALPGLFLTYQLSRRRDSYKTFLTHLETVFTQQLHAAMKRTRVAASAAAAVFPSTSPF